MLILALLSSTWCTAQVNRDSIPADSARLKPDSSLVIPAVDTLKRNAFIRDSIYQLALERHKKGIDTSIYNYNPFYRFTKPVRLLVTRREWSGKEGIFYAIVALLFLFAVTKNTFSRYLGDLFKVFFRTTVKQRQTRDQLLNAPLPSLLFNILYTLSAGLFITLLLQHFGLGLQYNFWLLFAYCVLGLLLIYAIKFITLKLCGWVLRASDATDNYIFIVFTTNKVIGIFLLPFTIGLAFMEGDFYEAVFFLSLCLLGGLFVYRFYLSYISIQKGIKINFFHFVLYLLAFEIIPLLLINKVLVRFF